MELARRENWESLLAAEVEAARDRRFEWGMHDCCAFTARCVAAITGRDFLAEFGAYASADEADSMIRQCGGVRRIARACLPHQIDVLFAGRGDVVLRETEDGDALGICLGAQCAFASVKGVVFHPVAECAAAWRV